MSFRCVYDGCTYETKWPSCLRTHVKVNHLKQVYSCGKCAKVMTARHTLEKHLHKVHCMSMSKAKAMALHGVRRERIFDGTVESSAKSDGDGHASAKSNDDGHASAKSDDDGHARAKSDDGHASAKSGSGLASAKSDDEHVPAKSKDGHASAKADNGHADAENDQGETSDKSTVQLCIESSTNSEPPCHKSPSSESLGHVDAVAVVTAALSTVPSTRRPETSRSAHKASKSAEKSFSLQCPHCDYVSSARSRLTQHIQGVHEKFRYVCDMDGCTHSSTQRGDIHLHQRADHEGLRYKYVAFYQFSVMYCVSAETSKVLTRHTQCKASWESMLQY